MDNYTVIFGYRHHGINNKCYKAYVRAENGTRAKHLVEEYVSRLNERDDGKLVVYRWKYACKANGEGGEKIILTMRNEAVQKGKAGG